MNQPVSTRSGPVQFGGPWWRALLEARWRDRLAEVTELSLEFHDAAAAAPAGQPTRLGPAVRRLMHQATAARRALADIDDALARLAAGRFGVCEYCGVTIPARTLQAKPEARYCVRCAGSAAPPGPVRSDVPVAAG